MSLLCGTWALESSENLNVYLKQLGMAVARRKHAVVDKPIVSIQKNDDYWTISVNMKTKGTETMFREDQDVDTSNELKFVFDSRFYFDSRRMTKSKFKFETPNKLVQIMSFIDTNEKQIIIREVDENDQMIEYLEMNGTTARRVFKRIK